MRVHIVDPSAFTLPYDHALAAALARAGADVELITSRFAYGEPPSPTVTRVRELFYRHARGRGRLAGAARREAGRPRARHAALSACRSVGGRRPLPVARGPGGRPVVAASTADRPDRPRPAPARAASRPGVGPAASVRRRRCGRRALASTGATARRPSLDVDASKVRVIHHGAFKHLTVQPASCPLPDELRAVECRWCCSSACSDPTRASTYCSTRGGGSTAPSCGSSVAHGCRSSRSGRARRQRPVRPALRLRRRAAGVLSPRRRRRAAVLADRAVRPVGGARHRARVRQADRGQRRGRVRRGRGGRRGAAGPAERSRRPARCVRAAAWAIRRSARASRGGRWPPRGGRTPGRRRPGRPLLFTESWLDSRGDHRRDRVLAVGRPDRLRPRRLSGAARAAGRAARPRLGAA